MKFEYFDRSEAHKNLVQSGYRIPDMAKVGVGADIDDRWLVTSKKFRPLRDLLALSKDSNTVDLCNRMQQDSSLQQFILAPELAYETTILAVQLSKDIDAVKRLMPKVMPPYSSVCVEMPITDQVRAQRASGGVEQLELRRVGAYIKTMAGIGDALLYMFVPYYEFTNGSVYASCVDLYHTGDNAIIPGCQPIQMTNFYMLWNVTFSPLGWKQLAQQNVPPESVPSMFKSAVFVAASNEATEEVPVLFFAWLALINSKSGIAQSKVSARLAPANLGKRQRLRRGRSGFTVLCLSDMEAADSEGVVSSKPQISAHRVRGHFKARKRGVFWWRPHVRGSGELKEREAYTVNK